MIIDTKHGQFECKDINRKERRALYKKVKMVGTIAFGDDKSVEKALGSLTSLQEDEVLNEIIASYMGLELGNAIGD